MRRLPRSTENVPTVIAFLLLCLHASCLRTRRGVAGHGRSAMLVPTVTLHPTNRSSEKKLIHGYRKTDRRNSSKSTGPKTREGKFKSSLNALRHGTYCETRIVKT